MCLGAGRGGGETYPISNVRVINAYTLHCRVQSWPKETDPVLRRLRQRTGVMVELPAMRAPMAWAGDTDSLLRDAAEALGQRIEDANDVRLADVRTLNSFEITAGLILDGEPVTFGDVRKQLIPEAARSMGRYETGLFSGPGAKSTAEQNPPQSPPADTVERRFSSEGEANQYAYNLLSRQVDLSGIEAGTTFEEALDLLKEALEGELPLVVMWGLIEKETLIGRDAPVGMEGFGRMQVSTGLDLILYGADGGLRELFYFIEGGTITILPRSLAVKLSSNSIYDITELVRAPGDFAGEDFDSSFSDRGR